MRTRLSNDGAFKSSQCAGLLILPPKRAEPSSYMELSEELFELSSLFARGAFETRKDFQNIMIDYKTKANEEIYALC